MGPESVSTELARPVSAPTLTLSPSVGGHLCPGSHGMSGSAGPFSCVGVFAVKRILKIQPHLAHVATLPCETSISAKQAINDKLQGSVATYLTCGGVVNIQINKVLLLSLRVKKFNIGEYLAKLQART